MDNVVVIISIPVVMNLLGVHYRQQVGDGDVLRTSSHAVAAGGAGKHLLPHHAGGHIQQDGLFGLTQRPVGLEGVQVGP